MNFHSAMSRSRASLIFLYLMICCCAAGDDTGFGDEICRRAPHPQLCSSSLKELNLDYHSSHDAHILAALQSARAAVDKLHLVTTKVLGSLIGSNNNYLKQRAAIRDCTELLEDAGISVNDSISAFEREVSPRMLSDIHTWVSAALTYHTTCMDAFDVDNIHITNTIFSAASVDVQRYLSNALALINSLSKSSALAAEKSENLGRVIGYYDLIPNITVAQDGSGNYTTIGAALDAAPKKSSFRFVIHIREGIYFESFEVPSNKPKLMFLGDGIGKTIITGNKSVQDPNITTFTSATVAIKGKGFSAQGITFQNTAGAIKHQAVALRVSADEVAFFRCSFEGFQDTLYAHSQRQFYSQCYIYGTVDFIFGNAAAMFQNCNLYARVPMEKQKNLYTAQGRTDPNQNTGFVFQNCIIDGVEELQKNISDYPTYLGRPWKEYSQTVYLKCFEGSVVNPSGWLPWDGDFALATLFYGEYFCYGPGSGTSNRVLWSTQIFNATFAQKFTAASFLIDTEWLDISTFPFSLDL